MMSGFTSLLTVFQSSQDDGRMILKGCMQWDPDNYMKTSAARLVKFEPLTIRKMSKLLTDCGVEVLSSV